MEIAAVGIYCAQTARFDLRSPHHSHRRRCQGLSYGLKNSVNAILSVQMRSAFKACSSRGPEFLPWILSRITLFLQSHVVAISRGVYISRIRLIHRH